MDEKDTGDNGEGSGPAGASASHGRRSLELGRREVNVEFLKRFGGITIPGIGRVTLLYKNPLRGSVSIHFQPSTEMLSYLLEENEHVDRKKQRFGERGDD